MDAVWIGRDGNKHGPYSAAQLLEAHANGKLRETDLLWWKGLEAWQAMAFAIEKLRAHSGAPAAASTLGDQPAQRAAQSPEPASAVSALDPIANLSASPAYATSGANEGVDAASSVRRAGGGVQRGGDPYRPPSATVADPIDAGEAVEYAGFWVRFAAFLVDTVIVTVAGLIIGASAGFLFFSRLADNPAVGFLIQGSGLIVSWLFYAWFESSEARATPGKMVFRLKVVGADDHERISFLRATGRYWAKLISAMLLGIGYLMQPFTARKQALHDLMSGAAVVSTGPASRLLLWLCLFLAFVPLFFGIFLLFGLAMPFARILF
jgi:uncharacterized RDD family membrane protein YckC